MDNIFDIQFLTTNRDVKIGYVMVKKYCRVGSLNHDCISSELFTAEDVDKAINTLVAELEHLRAAAKRQLKG